jgi:hypothetical protein
VSHSRERKEKICLNCNTELSGRFCHICGQENLEPKESVWALISHFFYDITHFDGKFFNTLGHLLRKPGFLPKEYLRGRRARYLNPIRMYVFTSALFFIIFFSMFNARNLDLGNEDSLREKDSVSVSRKAKEAALQHARTLVDSIKTEAYYAALAANAPDSNKNGNDSAAEDERGWKIRFDGSDYDTKASYDSAQKAKPGERHGWFARKLTYRFVELNNKYKGNEKLFLRDLLDKFIHTFPYLLFVSLPLYALFLKLLYIRRKQFFYVDHGIFLIHLYIFTFIVLVILFGLYKLNEIAGWGWVGYVQAALMIYGVFYTVKAMRNFYDQGWGRTILKFLLLNFLALLSLIFLFSLFFILSVFRI